MDKEDAYITLTPTVRTGYFLVCVMKWHEPGDEFIQTRVSTALKEQAAKALAESWAAAMGLSIR